jgi:DNA-binding response OmpR family regulator
MEAAMGDGAAKRVLVVEGDAPARGMIKGMVEAAGFEVVAADGMDSALGALESASPIDLVITGIGLPAESAAARPLAELAKSGRKVIYLSDAERGPDGPGNDNHILQKPVMIDALLRKIAAALGSQPKA